MTNINVPGNPFATAVGTALDTARQAMEKMAFSGDEAARLDFSEIAATAGQQANALAMLALAHETRSLALATLYAGEGPLAGVDWPVVAKDLRARLDLPEKPGPL